MNNIKVVQDIVNGTILGMDVINFLMKTSVVRGWDGSAEEMYEAIEMIPKLTDDFLNFNWVRSLILSGFNWKVSKQYEAIFRSSS